MAAAVENMIQNLRMKNAEKEQKRIADETRQAVDRKRKQEKLHQAEKKTLDALDKFKESLKRGQVTKSGEVMKGMLSAGQKDQHQAILDNLKTNKEDLAYAKQQEQARLADADQTQKKLDFQNQVAMEAKGISLSQLEEDKAQREDLKLQREALNAMLENDTMSAEEVKKTRAYQLKKDNIDRQERRLDKRAERQVKMQNLKGMLSLKGIADGIKGMGKGGAGILTKAKDAALPGIKTMLGGLGLAAAFFGLKAFLDSEMFQDLKDFMVSLAPQFRSIVDGFKKIFQGDIIGGLMDIFKGLAGIVARILDSVTTGLYNMFARWFGFEETDSVFKAISNAVISIGTKVSDLVKSLNPIPFIKEKWNASMAALTEFLGGYNPITDIFESIKEIWASIKAIFSGDFSLARFKELYGNLVDIIFYPINMAINAIKTYFEWGDPEQPFKLSEFIFSTVDKVWSWFKNLFTFDLSGIKEKIFNMGTMMKALAKGGVAAAGAMLPGGESPAEAFKRVYAEVMGTGGSGESGGTGTTQALLDMADERAGAATGDASIAEKIAQETMGGKWVRAESLGAPRAQSNWNKMGNSYAIDNSKKISSSNTTVQNQNIKSNDSLINDLMVSA